MHLLFIDESGTPPQPHKCEGQYLVIGGLVIPDATWYGVARDLTKLRARFNVVKEIKWKHFGQSKDDGRNAVIHLSNGDKDAFRTELFKIVTSRRAMKVIACVTSCEAAYKMPSIKCPDDIYELTYKGVTERFQYFLQDVTKDIGSHQFGMVIADHRMNVNDDRLRRHHHALIDNRGPTTSGYSNIIETIQFAPSDFSVGLQLVDMISGAIGRYFQYGEDRFVRQILPAFRTSPKGEVAGYGLVKMPKQGFIEPSGGGAIAPPAR